jgi:hypothetical protein
LKANYNYQSGDCCCGALDWELKLNIGADRRANNSKHRLSRPRLLNSTIKTCILSVAKAADW